MKLVPVYHDPLYRCEATAVRSGERCHRRGYFDPVHGEYRCAVHEARGERCEAYTTTARTVGRRCAMYGRFDHLHQRVLCDNHAACHELAFTAERALRIVRERNRLWMSDWRARQREAA